MDSVAEASKAGDVAVCKIFGKILYKESDVNRYWKRRANSLSDAMRETAQLGSLPH